MRYSIAILSTSIVAVLSGCATVPAQLAGKEFVELTPQQAVAQSATANGQHVRWGGEIINVDTRQNVTCFQILSRDLYADARPNRRDDSEGRFLACKPGFFDPAVYTKGRDITIVGALSGTEQHKVGQYDYTFAKVDAAEVYMWPKRAYSAYSDPWGPYWGGPYWGGYWGPGWGWGGGYWRRW